jgi:hypothetical protein
MKRNDVQLKLKWKKLVTPRYLDASTGHVKKEDLERLREADSGLSSYPDQFGAWLHVNSEVSGRALLRMGYSRGFALLYAAAKKAGCCFIRLDCDGHRYEGLPHYNW